MPEPFESVAIIGMAGRFPKAANVRALWRNLCAGLEAVSYFMPDELRNAGVEPELIHDPKYIPAGAILDDADLFDAEFFGFNPREAELLDPQHRIFLESAWHAFEDAGYVPDRTDGITGVFAGSAISTYLLRNLGGNPTNDFQTLIANDKDFLPSRVAYKLNLTGPAVNIQTACSTSLVAVHMACQSLLTGASDLALAGGVAIHFPQMRGYLYQEEGITSPDGHCRAFDAKAKGTVVGNGVGVVLLKRLSEAIADRDHIYAVIRGSAINNDGSAKIGYTAPGIDGQADVIASAQAVAGIEPETITYVETHGTGTLVGDPIEIAALTQAFGARDTRRHSCAIGSVKTNLGHLDTAAGITGLIKTALAVKHAMIPPSLHFETPNPEIRFHETPFYVNTNLQTWETGAAPRRAGVSSFGIGGTNAHVVLEQAPESDRLPASGRAHLLILSARNEGALEAAASQLAVHLQSEPAVALSDVAYTLCTGRKEFPSRLAFVAQNTGDAFSLLEGRHPDRTSFGDVDTSDRAVAFLFPGSGAQHVNMARALYDTEPVFREQLGLCADLLSPNLRKDIREFIFPPVSQSEEAAADLRRTRFGLPSLFAVEYAMAQLWISWGIRPAAMIGHSLGEYTAACLAGVFSLNAALELVSLRGRLMQTLSSGSMLAVSLPAKDLEGYLSGRLTLAAINGPSLSVASGPAPEIDALSAKLQAAAIEFRKLHVDVAAHSPAVDPILAEFEDAVRRLAPRPPRIPFVSNVSATWITNEQAVDPAYWRQHMRQTVRFAAGMREMLAGNQFALLEVGPGQTLGTLVRQLPEFRPAHTMLSSLAHPNDCGDADVHVLDTLGQLWTNGVAIDWKGVHPAGQSRCVPLPGYPFERRRFWVDAPTQQASSMPSPLKKLPDVDQWFYIPGWRRSLPPQPFRRGDLSHRRAHWLVFDDRSWFTTLLVKRLREENQLVVSVIADTEYRRENAERFAIRPKEAADYTRLLSDLEQNSVRPDRVIHLWMLEARTDLENALAHGYYSLLHLGAAIGDRQPSEEVLWTTVGAGVFDTSKAAALGPSTVIPQEYPHVRTRVIEMPILPDAVLECVERLLGELKSGPTEFAVSWQGRERLVRKFEKVLLNPEAEPVRPLRNRGVYLITGGFGRVGLLLARFLAVQYKANLVLLGRTALPTADTWDHWLADHPEDDVTSARIRAVRELEQLGAEVLPLAADVADEHELQVALETVDRRFGRLDGVLHAAGVTSGSSVFHPLNSIGNEESEMQFRPKVLGTLALERALSGRQLDFCALFSSNASVLGGIGFTAYSAANHFLDAFAASRAGESPFPWISANWDGWLLDESAGSAPMRTSMDEYSMTPSESAEAFRRVVTLSTVSQIVVSTGDLDARLGVWLKPQETVSAKPKSAGNHVRPRLRNKYVAPRSDEERDVALVWQDATGVEQIGVFDNFFEIGGHSLLAMQIISRLREKYGVKLTIRSLFEMPTVSSLVEGIAAQRAAIENENDLALLESIDALSDAEVDRELARRADS